MIALISGYILPAALRVLGPPYDSPEARALLLAIGLQESRFTHRAQVRGPARGFWQFEKGGGVMGVLTHPTTVAPVREAMGALRYHTPGETLDETAARMHGTLEHNDTLAAVFARLLLWTLRAPLPGPDQPSLGWGQYLDAWRPGDPHAQTWNAFYAEAWARVGQVPTAGTPGEDPAGLPRPPGLLSVTNPRSALDIADPANNRRDNS
jgi:hypothetical protein